MTDTSQIILFVVLDELSVVLVRIHAEVLVSSSKNGADWNGVSSFGTHRVSDGSPVVVDWALVGKSES